MIFEFYLIGAAVNMILIGVAFTMDKQKSSILKALLILFVGFVMSWALWLPMFWRGVKEGGKA